MGPLVGWDRDRQGQPGGKGRVGVNVLCVLCAGEKWGTDC